MGLFYVFLGSFFLNSVLGSVSFILFTKKLKDPDNESVRAITNSRIWQGIEYLAGGTLRLFDMVTDLSYVSTTKWASNGITLAMGFQFIYFPLFTFLIHMKAGYEFQT